MEHGKLVFAVIIKHAICTLFGIDFVVIQVDIYMIFIEAEFRCQHCGKTMTSGYGGGVFNNTDRPMIYLCCDNTKCHYWHMWFRADYSTGQNIQFVYL